MTNDAKNHDRNHDFEQYKQNLNFISIFPNFRKNKYLEFSNISHLLPNMHVIEQNFVTWWLLI